MNSQPNLPRKPRWHPEEYQQFQSGAKIATVPFQVSFQDHLLLMMVMQLQRRRSKRVMLRVAMLYKLVLDQSIILTALLLVVASLYSTESSKRQILTRRWATQRRIPKTLELHRLQRGLRNSKRNVQRRQREQQRPRLRRKQRPLRLNANVKRLKQRKKPLRQKLKQNVKQRWPRLNANVKR